MICEREGEGQIEVIAWEALEEKCPQWVPLTLHIEGRPTFVGAVHVGQHDGGLLFHVITDENGAVSVHLDQEVMPASG